MLELYNQDGNTSVCPKNKLDSQGVVQESKTVVRPAFMYSAETWAVKKAQEKKLQ